MPIENFNMYGGNYVEKVEVHDCVINMKDDGQISTSLKSSESSTVNSIKNEPSNSIVQKPITVGMIKTAATCALTMEYPNGKRIFDKIYYWQSIYRILVDEKFERQYKHFVDMVNNIFPEELLVAIGASDMMLKDPSIICRYNDGIYKKDFSKWVKEDSVTGSVDPRYLVAEKFKTVLDGLRTAEGIKQNND